MKILLFVILSAALCFGQSKPPVIPPKPEIHAHWFNTQPEVKDEIQNMVNHADAVFSVLHEQDEVFCQNGPSDTWRYPEVKRCDGVI